MKSDIQGSPNESKPVILTLILIIAAITVFGINGISGIGQSEIYLTISFWLFVLIDIGFIVSMVMGIRTKKTNIVLFSIIANGLFFVLLTFFLLLIGFAIGFSEA